MSLLLLISLIHLTLSCIPVSPVGPPNPTPTKPHPSTTTAPPCCSINIFDESAATGRALFHPELRECPAEATYICSVRADGNTDPTQIVLNGNTPVQTGIQGTNTEAMLTCRLADTTWLYNHQGKTIEVKTITCLNNAVGGKK